MSANWTYKEIQELSKGRCEIVKKIQGANPPLNQTEYFQYVRMRLTWAISCCVLNA